MPVGWFFVFNDKDKVELLRAVPCFQDTSCLNRCCHNPWSVLLRNTPVLADLGGRARKLPRATPLQQSVSCPGLLNFAVCQPGYYRHWIRRGDVSKPWDTLCCGEAAFNLGSISACCSKPPPPLKDSTPHWLVNDRASHDDSDTNFFRVFR